MPSLQGASMVRQNWTDDDLARRLHEHDPDALETLISRYSREVFYFIRLVLDGIGVVQDAEECVNDLFVAVWQEIGSFDPQRGTLRTWLTMRAKYIALDRRRQLCRRQLHSLPPADENRQWSTSDGNGVGGRNMFPLGGPDSESPTPLPAYSQASMEQLIEQSERLGELHLALATLPQLYRQLIYL